MAHPFPDERITNEIVTAEISRGGWNAAACPLCNSPAAIWRIENRDKFRYICPTCQRYLISGPQLAALRQEPRTAAIIEQMRRLSAAAATASDVLDVG
jgi:hypothetical protein